jgi:hypothetical protein
MFDAETVEKLEQIANDVENPHERAYLFVQVIREAAYALANQDDSDAYSYKKEALIAGDNEEAWDNVIWASEKASLTYALGSILSASESFALAAKDHAA